MAKFLGVEKSSFHVVSITLASYDFAISIVLSVDPVSTTTISSTAVFKLSIERDKFFSSFLTI